MAKLTIPQAIEYLLDQYAASEQGAGNAGCMITLARPDSVGLAQCPDCRALAVEGQCRAPHTFVGKCGVCGQWWNLSNWTLGLRLIGEQVDNWDERVEWEPIAVRLLDSELKEGE